MKLWIKYNKQIYGTKYIFTNGPSKIRGRQPLKNLKRYGKSEHTLSNFLKAVIHTNFIWSALE